MDTRFKKGHQKLGGRLRGGSEIKRNLAEMLDEMGCNPFLGLAQIAQNPKTPVAIVRLALADLAGYLKPKLKSVELTGAGGGPIQLDASPRKRLEDRLAGIAQRQRAS